MARFFVEANSEHLLTSSSPISGGFPVTIDCWFLDNDGSANDRNMVQIQDSSVSNHYYRIGRGGSGANSVALTSRGGGAFTEVLTTTTYTTNTWNHACGTFAASNSQEVWLNAGGNNTNTSEGGTPANMDSIAISGELDSTPADYWDGSLADVGIWDVILTDEEIAMRAAGVSALQVRPQSLVFYAPLVRGVTASGGNDKDIVGGLVLVDVNTVTNANDHPPITYPSAQILQFPPSAAVPAGGIIAGSLGLMGVGI